MIIPWSDDDQVTYRWGNNVHYVCVTCSFSYCDSFTWYVCVYVCVYICSLRTWSCMKVRVIDVVCNTVHVCLVICVTYVMCVCVWWCVWHMWCVSGDVCVIAHYLFTKMTPGKNDKYFITTLTDCRYRTSLPATIGKTIVIIVII